MKNFQFSDTSSAYFKCLRELNDISNSVEKTYTDQFGDSDTTVAVLEKFEEEVSDLQDTLFEFLKTSVSEDIENEETQN